MADILPESEVRRVGRGRWQALVRRGTPTPRARWLASLRFAAWWLPRYGALEPSSAIEHRLAAAVLAPRIPFLEAFECVGASVSALARIFICPQAMIVLRIGEVTGMRVALCDRNRIVRVRGAGGTRGRGLVKVRLTDDDRVGMLAS